MGGNKITGVGVGTTDSDVVNKKQLDVLKTLNTYYFTTDLKHNNAAIVKFPKIDSYPFSANDSSRNLKISLPGYYQVIYTDGGKNTDVLEMVEDVPSLTPTSLFKIKLNSKTYFQTITINAVVKITVNENTLFLVIGASSSVAGRVSMLDGIGYSSFYIKYLHA